jgi:hypothetical protein
MTPTPKFPFASPFQTQVLQLLVEAPEWATELKASYFDDPLEGRVCELIQGMYQHTQRPLTLKALADLTIKTLGKPAARRVLRPLLKPMEDGDRAYLLMELPKFVRMQSFGDALVKGARMYRAGNLERLEALWQEAARPPLMGDDVGLDYFATVGERETALPRDQVVRTLISDLDRTLLYGGVVPGSLNVVMGAPNTGKTWFLLWIVMAAVIQGKTVVLHTLDMSSNTLAQRMDSVWTKINARDLVKDPHKGLGRLTELGKRYGGRLIIKEWLPAITTVEDLHRHTRILVSRGQPPDLLLVDYGDLLGASRQYGDARHLEIFDVYVRLRALARGLAGKPLIVWSADQPTRASREKYVLTLEDTAEGYGKAKLADLWITLNATAAEEKDQKMRLFKAKDRDYVTRVTIPIHTDFEHGRFFDQHRKVGTPQQGPPRKVVVQAPE